MLSSIIPEKAVPWDSVKKSSQVQRLTLILFLLQQEGNYYIDTAWKSLQLVQDILTSIFFQVFPCLPKTHSWLIFQSAHISILSFSLTQPGRVLQQLLFAIISSIFYLASHPSIQTIPCYKNIAEKCQKPCWSWGKYHPLLLLFHKSSLVNLEGNRVVKHDLLLVNPCWLFPITFSFKWNLLQDSLYDFPRDQGEAYWPVRFWTAFWCF